ncbi:hypothetical protein [Kineosporia sp. A_224]|uniref:hypothetical protein n=1 Tax=Kineosporia sp. A_224 TaxID=1962180 RepID=UPI0018EA3015|nr:hypothetical protein [Kineosporia sp. A_224]
MTGAAAQHWDQQVVLERLTRARMESYLRAAGGGLGPAFARYEWNVDVSAAFLGVVGSAEVVVRNALDAQLSAWARARHGEETWFDVLPLDVQGRATLTKARDRASGRGRRPESAGRVIAELPLGFWRYLVAVRYLTTLWVPALHAAFRDGPADLRARRRLVERHLDRLHFLRNRVAHHEPVHRRDLLADHRAALELVGWACPDSSAWLAARSTVEAAVERRPSRPGPQGRTRATGGGPACRSGSG